MASLLSLLDSMPVPWSPGCWRPGIAAVACVLAGSGCGGPSARSGPPASIHPDTPLAVIGQLVQRSKVPDPQMAEYDDCLFVSEFRLLEIPDPGRLPEHILVALPGFLDRTIHPAASLKLGQVCRLDLPAEPGGSPGLKSMFLADDVGNHRLPLYFTTRVELDQRTASAFPERTDDYFQRHSPDDLPVPVPVVYPVSARAGRDRTEAIRTDREAIVGLLASKGGDWEAWHESLKPFFADLEAKVRENGAPLRREDRWFGTLRSARYREIIDQPNRGPIKMLVELSRQLRERGIDLIVVPFPFKEEVHAHYFSDHAPDDGWFAPWRQRFIHDLLEQDVEVIDVLPHFQRNDPAHPYVFYDAADLHPADGGIQIAADLMARRLERYEFPRRPEHPAITFRRHPIEVVIEPQNIERGGFPDNARYPCTQILFPDGSPVPSSEDSPSPVIVMGDSFTSVPAPGMPSANIVAHLALHLGEVPCHLLSMGSSDQAMRRLAREGGAFFAHRQVVIFAFSPNRLFGSISTTETGGWDLYDLPPLRIR